MRVRNATLVIPFVLSTFAWSASHAQTAPPTTKFTIGAKIWHASWLSYVPAGYSGITPNGGFAVGDSVNAVEGSEHTDVMPLLGFSYGKFFASASYGRFTGDFNVLTSPVILPSGQTLITNRTDHFKRRESDLNLGYSVVPGVGLVLGYKDATETRDTSLGVAPQRTPILTTKVRGLLLGASGNFTVHDRLSFYVQAGYGPARFKLRFVDPALGTTKANGRYLIGEIGLSYPIWSNANQTRGAVAAVGYRSQTVKTDSDAGVFQSARKLRDVRDGAIFALNLSL